MDNETDITNESLLFIKEPIPIIIPLYVVQIVCCLASVFFNIWITVVSYGNTYITGNYKVDVVSVIIMMHQHREKIRLCKSHFFKNYKNKNNNVNYIIIRFAEHR